MSDPLDRSAPNPTDDDRVLDDEGLHPSGEGVSETPIDERYEAIALHNDLARQLENVVATARAWARADGATESEAIAEALTELYDRVGTPPQA